jgi:hypothetical protein
VTEILPGLQGVSLTTIVGAAGDVNIGGVEGAVWEARAASEVVGRTCQVATFGEPLRDRTRVPRGER